MRLLQQWLRLDEGQDMLEYGLLAALIAIAAVSIVGVLGDHLNRFFWQAIGPSI
jgi:Flp pilus assembly pilin Flp